MTGFPTTVRGVFHPRRFGTQDYIQLDPDFPWKHGEIASLQKLIADRSYRPLRRVQYVVSLKPRFDSPTHTWALSSPWLEMIVLYADEYIGHTRCAKRTDWMICRAAMELFAKLEPSWRGRRLAAAKLKADRCRLPLRVRRGTGWGVRSKYRGIYQRIAERTGEQPTYVRLVGLGKKKDEAILEVLYQEVARIDAAGGRG
jgi:hypothetical protein